MYNTMCCTNEEAQWQHPLQSSQSRYRLKSARLVGTSSTLDRSDMLVSLSRTIGMNRYTRASKIMFLKVISRKNTLLS
jgi:hypothetical protein